MPKTKVTHDISLIEKSLWHVLLLFLDLETHRFRRAVSRKLSEFEIFLLPVVFTRLDRINQCFPRTSPFRFRIQNTFQVELVNATANELLHARERDATRRAWTSTEVTEKGLKTKFPTNQSQSFVVTPSSPTALAIFRARREKGKIQHPPTRYCRRVSTRRSLSIQSDLHAFFNHATCP